MGKRRQNRVKTILPVRISGMDSAGKPFAELVHTLDVSFAGARLGGVNALPDPGSVIALQCHHRKGNFEVAWVGRPGTARNKQIGLKNVEPGRDIFGLSLKDDHIVDDFVVSHYAEQTGGSSRAPRFLANGRANVHRIDSTEDRMAEIQDVSLTGCYLKIASPYHVGTEVAVTMRIDNANVQVFGVVRTCHPLLGMGIEMQRFASLEDETTLVAKLEAARKGATVQKTPAPPPPAASANAKTAKPEPIAGKLQPNAEMKVVKPDTAAISARLQKITKELEEVDQLIQSGNIDREVLNDFHEAVCRTRTTAWALQEWMEVQRTQRSPLTVLTYLNTERIGVAKRLCDTLSNELQRTDIPQQKLKLEALLNSVEKLFNRLAGMDFTLVEPDKSTAKSGPPKV